MTTFTIFGKPHAKQRARMTRTGRAYTPEATVNFEQAVATIAQNHIPEPMQGPVKVTILATFEVPKSWSKKKAAQHIHCPHTQRPDLDNLAKSICDGMNRIAYADDTQIYEMTVRKVWGSTPKTVVTVEELG